MERICGIHAVYEAIVSRKRLIERIHISRDAQSGKIKEILDLARQFDVPVRREDRAVIDRLSQGTVHQGIIAITAEAAGAAGIVVPERHSAPLNATVVKASAGASAHIPVVRVTNLVNAIDEM